ncbi:MAG TPA: hypothetical protein VE569_14590 [Acidimicrobiia bacterium]|nr:hypothetical protein [Acidimicrobiia bacterium]
MTSADASRALVVRPNRKQRHARLLGGWYLNPYQPETHRSDQERCVSQNSASLLNTTLLGDILTALDEARYLTDALEESLYAWDEAGRSRGGVLMFHQICELLTKLRDHGHEGETLQVALRCSTLMIVERTARFSKNPPARGGDVLDKMASQIRASIEFMRANPRGRPFARSLSPALGLEQPDDLEAGLEQLLTILRLCCSTHQTELSEGLSAGRAPVR